jgi:hypothetical protein
VRPLIRAPGTSRGPPLSREAAASISQVIVTLTLLLANDGSTNGFLAYSCDDMRSPMVGYELTPQAGCWTGTEESCGCETESSFLSFTAE